MSYKNNELSKKNFNSYMVEINDLNIVIRAESMLSSSIRNTIILFSLGVSISTLMKNKYNQYIAVGLYIAALSNGLVALFNYQLITNNIYKKKYDLPPKTYIYNIVIIMSLITVLTIYFSKKFIKTIIKKL